MTREEAIKIVRNIYQTDAEKEALETLIPELAESEDERIRKELIEALKTSKTVGELKFILPEPTREECIAYLEKQKVIAAIPDELVECYKNLCERGNRWVALLINAINGTNEQKEQKPLTPEEKVKHPLYIEGFEAGKEVGAQCEKVFKEQKPVPKFSVGDYVIDTNYKGEPLYQIVGIDKECYICEYRGDKEMGDRMVMHFTFNNPYLRLEQKPADRFEEAREKYQVEWSDEDNIGWDEAFACVTRAEKAAKNEEELQNAVTAEKWLKEIKFKYYVHPVKQEWSEEDEKLFWGFTAWVPNDELERLGITRDDILKKLKSIRPQPIQLKEAYKDGFQTARHATALTFMNYLDENRPEGKMGLSNAECEDIDKAFKGGDWAKIMRYYEKYRLSWKPSEEQIHAIVEALKYLPNNKDEWMILNTLVDVLRKLM